MMNTSVTVAGLALALATVAHAPTASAQERAEPRSEQQRTEQREQRERARAHARERRAEVAPRAGAMRAEALARAFAIRSAEPDRAVVGVTIGEGSARGVRVEGVTEGSPAERAGIRTGDYLTRVLTREDDVTLRLDAADADDMVMRAAAARRLTRALDDLDAGDEVTLGVASEGGEERTVRVTTVRADSLQPARAGVGMPGMPGMMSWRMDEDRATLGMSLVPSGTTRDTLGAFVAAVVPGGPAETAGVYEGQRVAAINGVDLRVSPADVEDEAVSAARASRLQRAMRDVEAGEEVTLRVWDGRAYRDVRVRSGKTSEVYEGQPFRGLRMLEMAPGGAGMRMIIPAAPPTPPTPMVAPRAPRPPGAPRAARVRVAPRAMVAPRARVAPVAPARVAAPIWRRWI